MKKLIVYFVIFIFSICLIGCGKQSQNASPKTTAIATTEIITSEEITELTTEASTEEPTTEYEIETIEYDCPIEYNEEMLTDFRKYLDDKNNAYFCDTGYDSPILRQILIDYVEEKTGIYNDSITIDNFRFFQFGGKGSHLYDCGLTFNSIAEQSENGISSYTLPFVRAVLIENDLRYIIDEIPYSYFEEKFPDIMNNYSSFEYRDSLALKQSELYDKYDIDTVDLSTLPDDEREIIEFYYLCGYNFSRTSYIYKHNIKQVRDINTNKIQLNPNEGQLKEINKGVSKIPGFIDNVMEVETKENYHECYGEYPEDVVN